jgi:transposase
MSVIIGVDPHKATHTAVAIRDNEEELDRITVRATVKQVERLRKWAAPLGECTWAIESAAGLGYLLAQQLIDAGEHVLDVPPTLAARIRTLDTRRSDKNDPNDARSVAIAALRTTGLRTVQRADHAELLQLLSKRHHDLGRTRVRIVCRLHAAIADLQPGGISKEMYASDADRLLSAYEPVSAVEHARKELALELLDDVRRVDEQLKASRRRIKLAVQASGTTLTELYGVGPVLACGILGHTGDVSRFASRDQFAAYNGTAPVERSSGGRVVHRLSLRGNRHLNHAIHMVAVVQIRERNTEGRAYFDRKVAEGKTKREALRSLKRQVSNAVFRQMVADTTS